MIVSTVVDKLESAGFEVVSKSKDHPAGGAIVLVHDILIHVCAYHMEVVSGRNKVIANNVMTMDNLVSTVRSEMVKYTVQ